jgi:hypothetical protein
VSIIYFGYISASGFLVGPAEIAHQGHCLFVCRGGSILFSEGIDQFEQVLGYRFQSVIVRDIDNAGVKAVLLGLGQVSPADAYTAAR